MTYVGIYALIAVFVAIYCGVDAAIANRGKLAIDDIALPLLICVFWPGVAVALGFFGIGFLFKLLCEKIAQAILHFKAHIPAKVSLENTIKKP